MPNASFNILRAMKNSSRRTLLRAGAVLGGGLLLPAAALRPAVAQSTATEEDPNRLDLASGPAVLGAPRPGTLYIIHGDGSDTTALWQEALQGIATAGGGAIRTTGEHVISRELTLPDVTTLDILGDGAALLRKAEPGREFRIFANPRLRTQLASLRISDIRFVGDWDMRPSMGGDASRCIGVRGYHRVLLRGLSAEGFRNMTFSADDCDEVLVDACRIRRSARDGINLTGSRFVKVTRCTIQNAWDDAIAVHVPHDVVDENRRWAALIADNQILQSNGIKVLGGRDVTITGNQILAPNNYGIYLGRDPYWREGGVTHRNVIVSGNIVSEMLAHEYLPGQGEIDAGIFVVDPGGRPLSLRITGNIVSKYKPSGAGVRFSSWGMGAQANERRLFTSEGWIDPELIYGHQGKGIGIRILCANAADESEIVIADNSFANLAIDVERLIQE